MALFGEKYGDVVRMVEVGDGSFSRELCGGTHVRSTAEIGAFRITPETSSAANVRRIEAVTGPEAVALLRRHDAYLREVAAMLRTPPEDVPSAVADLQAKAKAAAKARRTRRARRVDVEALLGEARGGRRRAGAHRGGRRGRRQGAARRADRVKGQARRRGDRARRGGRRQGHVRRVGRAGARGARREGRRRRARPPRRSTGGGGGGRDTMAQAGGRDPDKLDEALAVAREAIERRLGG